MIFPNKKSGFTLIELLVVVSIISLLASIIFASITSARSKAKDARRRQELHSIQNAMELYFDKHGTYWMPGGNNTNTGGGYFGYETGGTWPALSRVLANEGFLPLKVNDGGDWDNGGYMLYTCLSDGTPQGYAGFSYSISASLENPSATDLAHIDTTCNGTGANGTHTRYDKNYALP